MKTIITLALLLLTITSLTGCVGVAAEGVRAADNENTRNEFMNAALSGDAQAQYLVGDSYCCTPGDGDDGYYNNQKATEFLCMAAKQGHGAAALKLGKIHSGDRIDGVRLLRRAVNAVAGSDKANLQIAAFWLTVAQKQGEEEAREILDSLPPQDLSSFTEPGAAACTMHEVYGI